MIFLDHTAGAPLLPEALAAMQPYLTEKWLSPSGLYREARALKREVDGARRRIAELLGAQTNDVVFTSSGTESINLAVRGVALGSQHRGRHLITTQVEHRAVLDTTKQLEKQGWRVTYLPVDETGLVDLDQLEAALDDETALVSIMLANNEVGTIQPIAEVARRVKARYPAVPVHTDAIAAAGYLDMNVRTLGVDLLSLSAYKVGGPRGAGLLWARRGVLLQPQQLGGDQERGRRAGPEDVPAIMGMAAAFEQVLGGWEQRSTDVGARCARLIEGIRGQVPGAVLNGPADSERRLPQIASFCFEGVDGEALLMQLDVQGVASASGSACTSATLEPSHVLKAMAVPTSLAEGNLRLSLGPENTDEEIDRVIEVLPGIVERMRALRK
jgi:cysteine desulfurase